MEYFRLLSFLAAVLIVACEEPFKSAENECLHKYNVTEEQVNNYDEEKDSKDKNVLCFTKCFFENIGIIDKHGSIPIEALKIGMQALGDKSEITEEEFDCLSKVPKIIECEDVEAMMQCIDKSKFSH